MARYSTQSGFGFIGIVMVVASISLMGIVAFRFLDAQSNVEVADVNTTRNQPRIAAIQTSSDIDAATTQLDSTDLEGSFDSDLDAELNF